MMAVPIIITGCQEEFGIPLNLSVVSQSFRNKHIVAVLANKV